MNKIYNYLFGIFFFIGCTSTTNMGLVNNYTIKNYISFRYGENSFSDTLIQSYDIIKKKGIDSSTLKIVTIEPVGTENDSLVINQVFLILSIINSHYVLKKYKTHEEDICLNFNSFFKSNFFKNNYETSINGNNIIVSNLSDLIIQKMKEKISLVLENDSAIIRFGYSEIIEIKMPLDYFRYNLYTSSYDNIIHKLFD